MFSIISETDFNEIKCLPVANFTPTGVYLSYFVNVCYESKLCLQCYAFSALTLMVGWQEGHPACKKTEWWGAGVIICLERGAELHMAQRMPLPLTISCLSKIQIGFTFLVPAHLGCPGKGPLNRCCCCCVAISPNLFEDKAWLSFMTLFISNFSCLFNGHKMTSSLL